MLQQTLDMRLVSATQELVSFPSLGSKPSDGRTKFGFIPPPELVTLPISKSSEPFSRSYCIFHSLHILEELKFCGSTCRFSTAFPHSGKKCAPLETKKTLQGGRIVSVVTGGLQSFCNKRLLRQRAFPVTRVRRVKNLNVQCVFDSSTITRLLYSRTCPFYTVTLNHRATPPVERRQD